MKIGILGTANIAKGSLLPGAAGVEEVTVSAIAGRNPDKVKAFQEEFGIEKGYDSYEGLLADPDVNGVYIPLPNGLHYPWVMKALEAGKHVLCEKPLGTNEAQVADMFRLAEEKGLVLHEAFAYRQSQLHIIVRELIESGAIGMLKHMEANFTFMLNNKKNVRLSKSLEGGATYDIGCYNINLLRYLAESEPVRIQSTGNIGEESQVDEASTVMLEFANGVTAVSHCSFGEYFRNEYRIYGTEGTIYVPRAYNVKGRVEIVIDIKDHRTHQYVDVKDNYEMEVKHFSNMVSNGDKPIITKEDSLNNARVIDEILKQIDY